MTDPLPPAVQAAIADAGGRGIAVTAVSRSAPQDGPPVVAAGEPQHDVLRAAADRGDLAENAAGQATLVHPMPDGREIRDRRVDLDRLRNRHGDHCARGGPAMGPAEGFCSGCARC